MKHLDRMLSLLLVLSATAGSLLAQEPLSTAGGAAPEADGGWVRRNETATGRVPLPGTESVAPRAEEVNLVPPPAEVLADSAVPETTPFSNACQPPADAALPRIPKRIETLQTQLGQGFRIARRGPFLVASDLATSDFQVLVDGVLCVCRRALENDFFRRHRLDDVVTVYVFRDETSYAYNLERILKMKPVSPYGHYGHRQRYIVVNYETGPGTLVHEMTHALMAPDFPEAPIWISEGIASLYEQCRVEGRSLRGEANWRLPELKDALQARRATPLRALMRLQPSAFRACDESLHYAESRYFCKYMETMGLLREVYARFRDTYQEDPTGVRAVETAFGQSLPEIEQAWHRWLKRERWE